MLSLTKIKVDKIFLIQEYAIVASINNKIVATFCYDLFYYSGSNRLNYFYRFRMRA